MQLQAVGREDRLGSVKEAALKWLLVGYRKTPRRLLWRLQWEVLVSLLEQRRLLREAGHKEKMRSFATANTEQLQAAFEWRDAGQGQEALQL